MGKNLFLIFFIISINNISAQDFGVSISYSSKNIIGMDVSYRIDNNRFHFGGGYQFAGQKNKLVNERESNYGLTKIKDGNFVWLIDLGYGRIFKSKLSVNSEISIGRKVYFSNYKDNRFKDNGYSLVNKTDSKMGIGINLGYLITNNFEPFIGYNSIKNIVFGLRYSF